MRAPADGYALMLGTGEMAFLPFLKKTYRYDPLKDFTPVALVDHVVDGLRDQPEGAGADAARARELFQDASEDDPLRQRRGRRCAAYRGRDAANSRPALTSCTFLTAVARRSATNAISGQIEMASMGFASTRIAEWRAACGAGADRADAASHAARCADDRRGRNSGSAHGHLVRRDRTAQYAAGGRRAARSRAIDEVVHEKSLEERLFKIGCAVAWKSPAEFAAISPKRPGSGRRSFRPWASRSTSREEVVNTEWRTQHDMAERQEDRRLGDRDVRDLVGRHMRRTIRCRRRI